MPPVVYVLACCQDVRQLYAATLIFKTLRVGFPTSTIAVVDNASVPEARESIRRQAGECGAHFLGLDARLLHHQLLERTIASQPKGSAVFLDTDLCFWQPVEHWHFDALVAGRLIPGHQCEFTNCYVHPRVHTSFLWITDVEAIRAEVQRICEVHGWSDFVPLASFTFFADGIWQRFDTGANLYAALQDRVQRFTERELDAYDHLFCGSHLDMVLSRASSPTAALFQSLHDRARGDYRALKGMWRQQDEYFRARADVA